MKSSYTKKNDLELLRTIESNSVDLVLTDPPYIISKASGMDTYKKHLNAGGEHTKHPDGSKNHLALNTEFGNWDKNFTIKATLIGIAIAVILVHLGFHFLGAYLRNKLGEENLSKVKIFFEYALIGLIVYFVFNWFQ